MNRETDFSAAVFWGIIAAGVGAAALLIAVLAGYLLGHYTHVRTKTVAERTITRTVTAPGSAKAGNELQLAAPVALPSQAPSLGSIGAGVDGPSGLTATAWAHGPVNAADIAESSNGSIFVSTAGETGKPVDGVYLVRPNAPPVEVVSGLLGAQGVAWYDNTLYVSSFGRVDAYSGFTGTKFTSHKTVLEGLPGGMLGWNDDLRMGPEGRFYMGIASGCDHCAPTNTLTATIVSFLPNGSDLKIFATGVRGNSSLAFVPGTNQLFMSTNQRDAVDGKTPPDEFGLVQPGSFWGYPWCWQQGGEQCRGVAHPLTYDEMDGASIGLAFINGTWGSGYGLSAFGSEWLPGKVLRFAVKESDGTVSAKPEVFLTGIAHPGPVHALPEGNLLIASWATGTVYLIHHQEGVEPPAPGAAKSSTPSAAASAPAAATTTPSPAATTSTSSAAASTPAAATAAVKISTATISGVGPVLVNAEGHALYVFIPDNHSKQTCVSACAELWPPAKLASGQKAGGSGEVKASLLGSDPDPEGGEVVTYAGWPLYTYLADSGPGTDAGQGVNANGGLWYVISPAGTVIKTGG
jgi:glucose/arabinose dehydrogenase